jgi:hypothetical protein
MNRITNPHIASHVKTTPILKATFIIAAAISPASASDFSSVAVPNTTSVPSIVLRTNGVLISKSQSSTTPLLISGDTGANGMLWHPGKLSLMIGRIPWSESSIGANSLAVGSDTFAPGEASLSSGHSYSYGAYSAALNTGEAMAYASFAAGEAYASGSVSAAFGAAWAFGAYSSAFGFSSASGAASSAFGRTTAVGKFQTTVGVANVAEGDTDSDTSTAPISGSALFIVGNGELATAQNNWQSTPSNAFVVRKNGNAEVKGNLTVGGVITCQRWGDIPMFGPAPEE